MWLILTSLIIWVIAITTFAIWLEDHITQSDYYSGWARINKLPHYFK